MSYVLRLARNHKKWTGLLAFFAIASASALAAWIVSADGRGSGKVGNLQAPTVSAAVPASGDLLPAATGALRFEVNNPNKGVLHVKALQAPATPSGSTDSSNCPLSNFSLMEKPNLNINVPANTTSTITVPDAVMLDSAAPTSCQGVGFDIGARLVFETGPGA